MVDSTATTWGTVDQGEATELVLNIHWVCNDRCFDGEYFLLIPPYDTYTSGVVWYDTAQHNPYSGVSVGEVTHSSDRGKKERVWYEKARKINNKNVFAS